MKTFIVTLAVFFICLLQGLMGTKVDSESSATDKSQLYRCGYSGYGACRRGYFGSFGSVYYRYPRGFGYNGCFRSCYRRGICC